MGIVPGQDPGYTEEPLLADEPMPPGARIVLGLEAPTSGSALVDGLSIGSARGAERRGVRRRVQPVFQDPYGSLDPTSTIERVSSRASSAWWACRWRSRRTR